MEPLNLVYSHNFDLSVNYGRRMGAGISPFPITFFATAGMLGRIFGKNSGTPTKEKVREEVLQYREKLKNECDEKDRRYSELKRLRSKFDLNAHLQMIEQIEAEIEGREPKQLPRVDDVIEVLY